VLRPADADEVAAAWKLAVQHRGGPVAIVLSRQKLPWLDLRDRAQLGVSRGAYVVQQTEHAAPRVVLLATGSEVGVALNAAAMLEAEGTPVRVVSAPSLELFAAQDAEYRAAVLPAGVPRVAVEAAHSQSWYRWVGERGAIVGLDTFGASAPAPVLFKAFGITAERVVEAARRVLA
jgi:transketolase